MRRIFITVILALMVLAMGLATVWVRTRVLAMRYDMKQVAHTKSELEQKLRMMTLELATLKAPQRLATVASEYRGLRPPRSQDIVSVP